jgi:hypothetical protein
MFAKGEEEEEGAKSAARPTNNAPHLRRRGIFGLATRVSAGGVVYRTRGGAPEGNTGGLNAMQGASSYD